MTDPLWLSVARMLVGIKEVPGPGNNPLIIQWARDIGAPAWFNNDEQAWCAVGANRLFLGVQMPMARHPDPAKRDGFDLLRAKTYETYGIPLEQPALGCIQTFSRPEGHHVGLYCGERSDAYWTWGCNVGNAIGYTWIKKERLTANRWPAGVPVTNVGPIWIDGFGAVSTNEQ